MAVNKSLDGIDLYFDYMATTPVDVRVRDKMLSCLTSEGCFANPSSLHIKGRQAHDLVEVAKQQVARCVGAVAQDVIFTSGATEANNLALFGVAQAYQSQGKHIITIATEHKAVLEPCYQLQKQGFEVTFLKPLTNGSLDQAALLQALREDTILVSIMHVNNEIGCIHPICDIAKLIKQHSCAFLHVDAVQSVGKATVNMLDWQIDLLSVSAHKAYGPKGIGALLINKQSKVRVIPQLYGGSQQSSIRPGTLATQQIVGMGAAFELCHQFWQEDAVRIERLRNSLFEQISLLEGVHLNGQIHPRVPHNLNVHVHGVDGESLQLALEPLCISSGSACNAQSLNPSHVLIAMGLAPTLAHASIRFSLGRWSNQHGVDVAADLFKKAVMRLRNMAPKGE